MTRMLDADPPHVVTSRFAVPQSIARLIEQGSWTRCSGRILARLTKRIASPDSPTVNAARLPRPGERPRNPAAFPSVTDFEIGASVRASSSATEVCRLCQTIPKTDLGTSGSLAAACGTATTAAATISVATCLIAPPTSAYAGEVRRCGFYPAHSNSEHGPLEFQRA